jgi:hypothetical protein
VIVTVVVVVVVVIVVVVVVVVVGVVVVVVVVIPVHADHVVPSQVDVPVKPMLSHVPQSGAVPLEPGSQDAARQ